MDAFDHPDRNGEVNPYPSSAVAQIADAGSTSVTIQTVAVRRAVNAMDAYLANVQARPDTPAGQVLAIVGDYGTGKTHLAAYLIRHAADRLDGAVQSVHLNAPPDTFVSLYRTFADKLAGRRELVHERVRGLYAEILAHELGGSTATEPLAEQLRAGAIDPVELVERFGLMESVFLRELRERLRQVTDNSEFSQALTLLLRGGFEDAVWEWFGGAAPAEVLRERGISEAITSSETTALQAMGVFALLIGHGDHPFVVVIDELDQLLTAAGLRADEAIDAFKEMLRIFAASNTFLILAGLPDLLNSLRRDVRERITEHVQMSALTPAEVEEYVRLRQGGRLEPFTEATVAQVVNLTNGVARQVISLCHQLWRRARDQRTLVTPPMVRQTAREIYDIGNAANVRTEIRQVLVATGYHTYIPDYPLGDTQIRVDYWVPVARNDVGCAILLSAPLIDDADIAVLERRCQSIRAHRDCELLLVVLEPPPAEYRMRLQRAVGREPLTYRPRSFADQFALEFKAIAAQLEERYPQDGPLAAITPHLTRLAQRQSATQQLLTLLTASFKDLRGRNDRQLDAIYRELHEIRLGLPTVAGGERGGQLDIVATLPPPVVRLFDAAFTSIDLLTPTRELLRRAFEEDDSADGARRAVKARMRTSEIHAATGVTTLLTSLIEAFGQALVQWYRTVERPPGDGLSVRHRERLDEIRQIFDVVYQYLPLYQLRSLRAMIGYAGLSLQQEEEAEHVLADFSSRVQRELLVALSPAEG